MSQTETVDGLISAAYRKRHITAADGDELRRKANAYPTEEGRLGFARSYLNVRCYPVRPDVDFELPAVQSPPAAPAAAPDAFTAALNAKLNGQKPSAAATRDGIIEAMLEAALEGGFIDRAAFDDRSAESLRARALARPDGTDWLAEQLKNMAGPQPLLMNGKPWGRLNHHERSALRATDPDRAEVMEEADRRGMAGAIGMTLAELSYTQRASIHDVSPELYAALKEQGGRVPFDAFNRAAPEVERTVRLAVGKRVSEMDWFQRVQLERHSRDRYVALTASDEPVTLNAFGRAL